MSIEAHAMPSDPVASAGLQAGIESRTAPLRAAVTAACRRDERAAVRELLEQVPAPARHSAQAQALARQLVQAVRTRRTRGFGVDALMHAFPLATNEGLALMALAEALLRIPDAATAERLIADKLSGREWRHRGSTTSSPAAGIAAFGLQAAAALLSPTGESSLASASVRQAMKRAMHLLARQFVAGRTIEEALARAQRRERRGYRHSYDMLGEAALTAEDARRYLAAYEHALHAIGPTRAGQGVQTRPGISIKLSALHPHYARAQRERVLAELLPRLKDLFLLARRYGIGINIDAEEADRLELSLDLLEALVLDPDLDGFDGIGFVVQAYQKRCLPVVDYLIDLARQSGRRLMLRLVKGAYWDTEIRRAQVDGLPDYPVFTRKAHTDACYLACAHKLLGAGEFMYPQFATHNAHTVTTIRGWAREAGLQAWEFQCLHGMGETLYDALHDIDPESPPCRIYAPVGNHQTLLPYLVRRLLENGANTSFVSQILDKDLPLEELLADPFALAQESGGAPHPRIPLPAMMFGKERRNSRGLDLNDEAELRELEVAFTSLAERQWRAQPQIAGVARGNASLSDHNVHYLHNPADRRDTVGQVLHADDNDVDCALAAAAACAPDWAATPAPQRAALLERAADLLEEARYELMALAVREAGKTLPNAVAEVREAVDFLRYYAAQVKQAERGRALGPVVCISPWNFPLAIFIGEVAAALAAGNVVLAKPAEQTPLIAHRAVELLHAAGIPHAVLQCLPGPGETVGVRLVAEARVRGVLFTGSTEVAQRIDRTLARRRMEEGRETMLIAETGGQNAMIVDTSALPEQLVQDVLVSAFDSAGQRCSALRVLCLPEEIAERTLAMLKGAMRELRLGNPLRLATDVGPVIDDQALQGLHEHINAMDACGTPIFRLELPPECAHGSFLAPTLIEIDDIGQLRHEVFGPVLHVLRYRRERLPQLVEAINATGYGLTLGVHTRIDATVDFICRHARVGNIYINRNIIGAVVGVQPFGGEGKSGTGPKAGGPLYMKRLRLDDEWVPPARPVERNAALAVLHDFAASHDLPALAHTIAHYGEFSLLDTEIRLPGPTGERNTLRFVPRGDILCAATGLRCLLNQVAACLATGNRIAMPTQCAALLPGDLPAEIRRRIRICKDPEDNALRMALVDAGQAALSSALAEREGALLMTIECREAQAVPLWRLVTERSVCVNTVAAGGNAALMTMSSRI